MPTYVFSCDTHGEFDAKRRMADRDEPAECPTCGNDCQRVFCTSGEPHIIPARWHVQKAGIREVTGGHSMNDVRHNPELRARFL